MIDSEIVGYFNWRSTFKGGVVRDKILRELRDKKTHNPNHQEVEAYTFNLLLEVPLDKAGWGWDLDKLAEAYPAPKVEVSLS